MVIEDTGIGLKEENMSFVFQRFCTTKPGYRVPGSVCQSVSGWSRSTAGSSSLRTDRERMAQEVWRCVAMAVKSPVILTPVRSAFWGLSAKPLAIQALLTIKYIQYIPFIPLL